MRVGGQRGRLMRASERADDVTLLVFKHKSKEEKIDRERGIKKKAAITIYKIV